MGIRAMAVFWRIGFRAVFAAAIAGTAAWWHASTQPDLYRATALLLLDTRPFESQERATRAIDMISPDSGQPAAFLRPILPPPLAMPDIAAILQSDEVAAATLDALDATRPELLNEAGLSTRARVRNALSVEPRVLLQTPREIFYQHTLELHATATHPDAAAELANAWVGAGMEALRRSMREGSDQYVQYLQARLEEVRASHVAILDSMEAMQGIGGVSGLEEKLDNARQQCVNLAQEIENLNKGEWPLGRHGTDSPEGEARKALTEESLASAQNELAEARRRAEEFQAQLDRTRRELAELEPQKWAYESLVTALTVKLAEVRLATGDPSPVFRIVSRAYVPEYPDGPNRRLLIASATVFGLALGVAHFFVMRALRHYAPLFAGDDA